MIDETKLYRFVGERIRGFRKEARLTQKQLAQILSLERTSITNIELGNQKAPLHVVYELCAHFQRDMADVLPPVSAVLRDKHESKQVEGETVTVGSKSWELPPKAASLAAKLAERNESLPERTATLIRNEAEKLEGGNS